MPPANPRLSLSKSLFIRGVQCHKSLYLDRYRPELRDEISETKEAQLKSGTEVGIYAQQLFPGGVTIPYEGLSIEDQLARTQEAIKEGAHTLYEGAFKFHNIFIKVDILTRQSGGWELYEVKGSTGIKDYHLDDVAIQYYVLSGVGLPIKKASLVHLNNQYIRNGAIEIQKLFAAEALTDAVKERQAFVSGQVSSMRNILKGEAAPDIAIGAQCHNPFDCDFLGHCWKDIPENSVFDLRGRGVKGLDLYQQGILLLKDIPLELLNRYQKMQVEAFVEKKNLVYPEGIKIFLDSLWYPLYFLDFETFQTAIPPFDRARPYQQIPFQYSLHYLKSQRADLRHYEFLARPRTDPRRELLEKLLSEIPEGACVLAYNMTFEKMILRSLGEWYPEYSGKIQKVVENMRDLADPFRKRDIYLWKMQGSYSLKEVVPAMVPDLSYESLEIGSGDLASFAYSKMNEINDQKELATLRKNLLAYCFLDTLSMVRILNELQRKLKNKE